jgi:hypothetical protein
VDFPVNFKDKVFPNFYHMLYDINMDSKCMTILRSDPEVKELYESILAEVIDFDKA